MDWYGSRPFRRKAGAIEVAPSRRRRLIAVLRRVASTRAVVGA
jgi:hypothetical protein